MLHNFPPLLHITPHKERGTANDTHQTKSNTSVEGSSNTLELGLSWIGDILHYVRLHRACDTKCDGDAVIEHSVDEGHSQPLMLGRHVIRENDGGGRERHIHTKWHDDN